MRTRGNTGKNRRTAILGCVAICLAGTLALWLVPALLDGSDGGPGQADTTQTEPVAAETSESDKNAGNDGSFGNLVESGQLAGQIASQGEVSAYEVAEDLPAASTQVLRDYQARGSCVLAQAGYLDLLGDVWSCTVVGGGWVEVVVVRSLEDGAGSEVKTIRMDASEWEEGVPAQDGDGSDGASGS